MVSIESTGKSVREAIEEGLKKLNKSLGEVEVKILSQGGLLRKARVQITVSNEEESGELNIDYLGPKKQRTDEENEERERRYQSYSENVKIPDDKAMSQPVQRKEERKEHRNDRRDDRRDRDNRDRDRDNRDRDERNRNNDRRDRDNRDRDNRDNRDNRDRNDRQNKENRNRNNEHRNDRNRDRNEHHNDRNEHHNDRNNEHRQNKPQEPKQPKTYTPLNDDAIKKAQDFLSGTLNGMGITHTLETKIEDNQLNLIIVCDSGVAIGYRGETLSALEYLTCLSVSRGSEHYKIAVDCNGYKEKREQSLITLAERMATKAIKSGRKVILEPMSSSSRKVIHSVLATNDRIITRSEGSEPNRRIVIIPKRNKGGNNQNQPQQKEQEAQEQE